jgi:nucleoside-diphosphate-sugar epimerase
MYSHSNLHIKFLINLMQQKVMVMGGSGLAGRSLLKLLSTKDVQVIATSRNPEKVK